jgi:hypothetical protein
LQILGQIRRLELFLQHAEDADRLIGIVVGEVKPRQVEPRQIALFPVGAGGAGGQSPGLMTELDRIILMKVVEIDEAVS